MKWEMKPEIPPAEAALPDLSGAFDALYTAFMAGLRRIKSYVPNGYGDEEHFEEADTWPETKLVTSQIEVDGTLTGNHIVAIDLDIPAMLVPSSTPGHSHLYIRPTEPMSWEGYSHLLRALHRVGIIQTGYLTSSLSRGYTTLRTPWTKKKPEDPYLNGGLK